MIKRALIFAFAVSCFAVCGASGDKWMTLEPNDSTFKLQFPVSPQVAQRTVNDPQVGKILFTTYSLAIPSHIIYMAQDVRFANGLPPDPSGQALTEVVNSFAKSSGATVVSTTSTTMQGHPALVMMLQKGSALIRGFTLNAKSHNFVVIVVAKQDEINGTEANKYLNSFKVTA